MKTPQVPAMPGMTPLGLPEVKSAPSNFAYNVALAHWREMISEHGGEAMRDKFNDMVCMVGHDRAEIEALRQALEEEGE